MLTDIANKIEHSKFHWTDIAIQIGIDKNDVFKIKERNDSPLEFVCSVTQKIWNDIFHFVGLNLTDNDFTEISSIAKYAISIGLRCVITMDNIRLFNDFIKLHNIDIYTYRTIDDKNLLHIASEYDAVSISQILINDYKIDVNLTGRSKKTPLHLAACCGSLNCTDTLLKNGADVNAKNEGDETPLHKSSYKGYINIVRLLLDNGADVNVKDKKGGTPLHKSADKGFINIAQVLLTNGADVNVKNEYGNTAINLAEIFHHHDIVELLKC